ncbi:MAG: 1-deoxy-D-xylulose-5-phosphate reductoisomerase [Actinomycetota bacterium]
MSTSQRRRVVVLGSTGSIGRQALDVIQADPERFEVVALVAGSDADGLEQQAGAFGVTTTGLGAEDAAEIATHEDADIVLNAIVGAAGLRATIAALERGKIVALANKESLVAGGEACARAAELGGGTIVPVDSEHAALAQALEGRDRSHIAGIVITASGGPFRTRSDLEGVSPEEALAHPTWSMGPKITIDSATLMNKGLEVIEAHHLFGFSYDDIHVIVHPQSVVHGMVTFVDGTVLMQAAPTDMRIPIQAALSAPERFPMSIPPVDLAAQGHLDFEPVDTDRFPSLELAYEAGRRGRSFPAVLNAVNEEAVRAFLGGAIGFTDIARIVEAALGMHHGFDVDDLESVLQADAAGRRLADEIMDRSPQRVGGHAMSSGVEAT